MQAGIN